MVVFRTTHVFRRYAAIHLNASVLFASVSPSLTEQLGATVPTGLAVRKCPVRIANTATSNSCQGVCGFLQCIRANFWAVSRLGS